MTPADRTPTRLTSPRFLSFLGAQFLGAANDNAFKFTLTMIILARVADPASQVRLTSLATLLFPVPFLLFSPVAGFLADRFRKSRFLPLTKSPEILAMALSIPALASESIPFLMVVLFLMATQSAFFSPVKYGLLPEIVAPRDLSMANGILQLTTNLAILAGSVAGVLIFAQFRDRLAWVGGGYLAVALLGTAATLYVPRTPEGRRDAPFVWNLFRTARDDWREARRIPVLFHTMFGIAFFGFLGALFITVIPVFAKNTLSQSERGAGLMMMLLSVGIGLGSVAAGKLSRGRVEIGLVPIGSIGLTLLSIDLALFGASADGAFPWRAAIDLFLLGVAAGLYIVPLNALLQQRSPEGMKGRMIAFSNVLTFTAVLFAAAVPYLLTVAGFDTTQIVLAAGLLSLGATLYIVNLLPDFLVRLVLYVTTRTFYRLRVEGEENLPSGGALLVANHVSWVDPLLIGSGCDRMIRFMMFRPFYEIRGLNGFLRRMHAIPIAGGDDDDAKREALEHARREIAAGHLVCIFAEGAVTRTGNLLRFRRGLERIASGLDAPIVPVCLDGIWGSAFSWRDGRFLIKWPRRHSEPVRVIFGAPLPSSSSAEEVRRRVQELSVTAFSMRRETQSPLAVRILRTAQRFRRRPFVADSRGRQWTFGETLDRALALRDSLFGDSCGDEEPIGLLLPPGLEAVLANLAVLFAGKVPANLELDASPARRLRQLAETGARVVLTPGEPTDWDADLKTEGVRRITIDERPGEASRGYGTVRRWLRGRLPVSLAERRWLRGVGSEVDRTAAIVFSNAARLHETSGGVLLSHHNLLSNLESLQQVFRVSREDRILGMLPFSSAFGLTGTLLLPAIAGVPVVFHDDPLDAEGVSRTVERHGITLLPIAPPHVEAYLAGVDARAFAGLRQIVVAGGNLSEETRDRFTDKFGIEPLEGFGCAECSPLVSLNVPLTVRKPHGQAGTRPGTSGHPLPGVAVRIVDPDSGQSVPTGTTGRLVIKGPNVMQGYLAHPELTASAIREGWFDTGESGYVDADGFLTVLGAG